MEKRSSIFDATLLALLCVTFCVIAWHIRYPHDDAFISFHYARNLAQGYGFRYNAGGERVEGFTNFLWVLLVAPSSYFNVSPLLWAQIMGMLFGTGTILATYFLARRLTGSYRVLPLFAAFALASNFSLMSWATTGLETNLFAFLMVLGVSRYLRELEEKGTEGLWGIIFGIMALTRPEGWFLPAFLWGYEIFWRGKLKNRFPDQYKKNTLRILTKGTVFFLAIFVPYFIWRFLYFGYVFPNSYYAKVGLTFWTLLRGIRYTGSFVNRYNLLFLLFIPSLIVWRRLINRNTLFLVWFLFAWAVYVTIVGGDHMSFYRFYVPTLAFMILVAVKAFYLILKDRGIGWRTGIISIAVCLWLMPWTYKSIWKQLVFHRDTGRAWVLAGKALEKYAREGQTLAVTNAGAIPYYSKLETLDMLGLNEVYTAHLPTPKPMGRAGSGHEKGDAKYVMGKKPDYIILFPWITKRPTQNFNRAKSRTFCRLGKDLIELPEFNSGYKIVSVPMEDGRYLNVFQRKDIK